MSSPSTDKECMLYVNFAIRTYPKSLHDGRIEAKIRRTESGRTRQTEKTVDWDQFLPIGLMFDNGDHRGPVQ